MRTYRVKELAKQRGLTQFDLALKSGVNMTTVQRLWQNRAPEGIRYKNLEAVAAALEVEVKDLFVEEPAGESQLPPLGNKKSLVGAGA
jgi:transcriptional regulator with XRE-family HTH domain